MQSHWMHAGAAMICLHKKHIACKDLDPPMAKDPGITMDKASFISQSRAIGTEERPLSARLHRRTIGYRGGTKE